MTSKQLFYLSLVTIFAVLFIDQASKIWVKTHMQLNEEFPIFGQSWARIHFIENDGMAFGLSFGGDYGKLFLSLFRIVAVSFLIYLLAQTRHNCRFQFDSSWSRWKYNRQRILWSDFFQISISWWRISPTVSSRRRLCAMANGLGSRYVLFPYGTGTFSELVSYLGRRRV